MRRVLLFVASATIATAMAVSAAGASVAPIGRGQIFNGFVNGQLKNATIRMACAGPVRPGQLGHPAGGQTLATARSLDLQPSGYTGNAHMISADLTLRFPVPHTVHLTDFAVYGTKNLPTRIEIPCAGDGEAVFTPIAGGPSARSVSVHVNLIGQP
ncbi:MAG: hypothetical protein QOK39_2066 [Acidimicrobiaceae bacterium]|jgi:hypothetical protein|nr:hypothetical protein [Acidimicrobiaceae bacterium]